MHLIEGAYHYHVHFAKGATMHRNITAIFNFKTIGGHKFSRGRLGSAEAQKCLPHLPCWWLAGLAYGGSRVGRGTAVYGDGVVHTVQWNRQGGPIGHLAGLIG